MSISAQVGISAQCRHRARQTSIVLFLFLSPFSSFSRDRVSRLFNLQFFLSLSLLVSFVEIGFPVSSLSNSFFLPLFSLLLSRSGFPSLQYSILFLFYLSSYCRDRASRLFNLSLHLLLSRSCSAFPIANDIWSASVPYLGRAEYLSTGKFREEKQVRSGKTASSEEKSPCKHGSWGLAVCAAWEP